VTTDALADWIEIHQALMRYCRGIDRGDAELIRSAYHDDGVDRHFESEPVAAADFAAQAVAVVDGWKRITQHHVTNVLIEVDGDTAAVESYYLGVQPTPREDGTEALSAIGGRYLDRFERRDGRWAIVDRLVVIDWSREELPGEDWALVAQFAQGGRREADPSHGFFRKEHG
jgi:hypothetical protein